MPRVVRRTPLTEKASGYGYGDFLKDIVQKTIADTTAGFKRPLDFSDEEIMEMGFAGLGGGIKKVPKFANMDETVMFVRELLKTPSRGAEYIPAMKQEMKWSAEKALKASKKPYSPEQFQEVMNEGVRRQWYREAYEVLSGRMPPWGEMP